MCFPLFPLLTTVEIPSGAKTPETHKLVVSDLLSWSWLFVRFCKVVRKYTKITKGGKKVTYSAINSVNIKPKGKKYHRKGDSK